MSPRIGLPSGAKNALSLAITLACFSSQTALAQQPANGVKTAEPAAKTHPLDPAIQHAKECLQHMRANVRDYTALFSKRCRVDGTLGDLEYANVKIRNRKVKNGRITTPMAVYLDFIKPSSVKGREVIWVETKNRGKLIAHQAGFLGKVNFKLDPNGYMAMRGKRYPITEIGLENIAVKMIETAEREKKYGECQVQVVHNAKVGDADCTMYQFIHPVEREHFDFYCAQVFFDNKLKMPVRYVSWSWPENLGEKPPLEEEFSYKAIKVNVQLTDNDFETNNSNYRFR